MSEDAGGTPAEEAQDGEYQPQHRASNTFWHMVRRAIWYLFRYK